MRVQAWIVGDGFDAAQEGQTRIERREPVHRDAAQAHLEVGRLVLRHVERLDLRAHLLVAHADWQHAVECHAPLVAPEAHVGALGRHTQARHRVVDRDGRVRERGAGKQAERAGRIGRARKLVQDEGGDTR